MTVFRRASEKKARRRGVREGAPQKSHFQKTQKKKKNRQERKLGRGSKISKIEEINVPIDGHFAAVEMGVVGELKTAEQEGSVTVVQSPRVE